MLLALDVSDILRVQLLEGNAMKADNKEILEKKSSQLSSQITGDFGIGCLRHLENSAIGGEGKKKKLSYEG